MTRGIILLTIVLFTTGLWALAQEPTRKSERKKNRIEKNQEFRDKDEDEEEQDSVPMFEFGLNFGAYFPSKYSANYYNGAPGNVNTAHYVINNKYWYEEIRKALNVDTLKIQSNRYGDGYPRDMHYQVAFTGGLFTRLNLHTNHALFLQANYTQLKAEDILVLEVNLQNYTYPFLRYQPIIGKEGRVLIDFGYQYAFRMKSKIYFFVQVAATMSYTQVIKSFFAVEGREYSMIDIYSGQSYIPNTNMQTNNIYQNAFGFGGFIGAGAGIPLTEMFGLEPGFFMQYYPTNLANYPDYKPNFGVILRLMLDFSKKSED